MSADVLGGRYRLLEVIGRGASGRVWLASDEQSGERVAVKVLDEELLDDPVVVARFERERDILRGIAHPNVVPVRDVVSEDGRLGIVMDLVGGGDLRRRLSESGNLAPVAAVDVVAQVLAGVAEVHRAGIAHRDLKPENVLLEPDEGGAVARVSDFGIARASDSPTLTRRTGMVGTPDYMAPELVNDAHGSLAVDVYSCGIMLYEALFGQTPFGGGHPAAVLHRHIHEPIYRPDDVPDELWDFVSGLTSKDPAGRPSAAEAMVEARKLTPVLLERPPMPLVEDGTLEVHRQRLFEEDQRQTTYTPRPGADGHTSDGATTKRRFRVAMAGGSVLVLLVAVLAMSHRSSSRASATNSTSTFAFTPAVFANGLTVTRTWTLGGQSGDRLQESLHLTNSSQGPINDHFDDVIPKQLAQTTDQVTFSPQPDSIVNKDPVVRYELHDLAPKHFLDLAFEVKVPPNGISPDRLKEWANDQADAERAYQQSSSTAPALTLKALTVTPTDVPLTPGQSFQLSPGGTMSDGKPAPATVLAGVAWTSSNPGSVSVVGGLVSGINPGTATVTAQAGELAATVTVTVTVTGSSGGGQVAAGPAVQLPAPSYTPPEVVRDTAPDLPPITEPPATQPAGPQPTDTSPPATPPATPTTESVPTAPSSASIGAIDSYSILVRWLDNADNEDGYRVTADSNAVWTVGPDATSYVISGLSPGTYMCANVRAFNVAGDSPQDDAGCTTTPPEPTSESQPPPPPPPDTPPPPPPVIDSYNRGHYGDDHGHYVPAPKYWSQDFVAQSTYITDGWVLLGANADGNPHQAQISLCTAIDSGCFASTIVDVSGYGGVSFSFGQVQVSPGTTYFLKTQAVNGDYTAYDNSDPTGGPNGWLIARISGHN